MICPFIYSPFRRMTMQLEDKVAVVYGGAGSIGSAVARAFAREGATVFLAGRTLAALDAVAHEITADGGRAATAQVDAHDQVAVDAHAAAILDSAGRIDVSFNAINMEPVGGPGIPPSDGRLQSRLRLR
jgi:3-oxoacyl-[acyl-carrier protein] reductase